MRKTLRILLKKEFQYQIHNTYETITRQKD